MAGVSGDGERRHASVPIPSYDEAVSSAGRSQHEEQDTSERRGLLREHRHAYQPPSVESTRTSLASDDDDDDLQLPEMNGDDERRQIEELDFLDAPDTRRRSPRLYHRSRSRRRTKWSQHFSNLGATLSSIRIPSFRLYRPVTTDSTPLQPADTSSILRRVVARLTIPERFRMSSPNFARLCGLFTLVFIIYAIFAFDILPRNRHRMGALIDPEALRAYIQQHINPENIRKLLNHTTSFDHVAGTTGDLYMAKWLEERWREDGGFDEVQMMPYHVYINYPGERSVSITSPRSRAWLATLEEDPVYSNNRQQSKVWHAYSRSGTAEGHLIYANEGSLEDFAYLKSQGILTNGSIVLIKYGGPQRDASRKVRNAAEAGCAGVLLYSDPSDFGMSLDWQPPDDMVQRSSIGMHDLVIGDPLTPGWASTLDANRLLAEGNLGLPTIPSLPLSWRDAKVLVESLHDHGERVPMEWMSGHGEGFDQERYTGCSPSEADPDVPIVEIKNVNDDSPLQQIWNIHGLIEGLEDVESKVLVGSPRDAFCFGASESGSGSAIMTELVRLFGGLRAIGWRPLRSIEFISWDAREFNFAGSTEYVEDHLEYLRDHAVAYINVDGGVSGADFHAAGSPLLQRALMHVLGHVNDPEHEGLSMKMWWESSSAEWGGPDASHDSVAFQYIVGTTSMDLGFAGQAFPQHSCHDTFEWMETHGDPAGLSRHSTLAQIWALLILELADRPLLPLDMRSYAQRLEQWAAELERDTSHTEAAADFTLQPLKEVISNLTKAADTFHTFEDTWTRQVLASGGLEAPEFSRRRWEYNNRLAHFDAWMLDLEPSEGCSQGGLRRRCQYKHTIFGPPRGDGDIPGFFPFIRDAAEDGDWPRAQRWVDRVTARLSEATRRLME